MNTQENNRILSDFLHGENSVSPLQFHENWNELMQVVEKILQKCAEMDEMERYWNITDAMPYIDNVHNTCVEFVKWHNEQNK